MVWGGGTTKNYNSISRKKSKVSVLFLESQYLSLAAQSLSQSGALPIFNDIAEGGGGGED